MKLPSVLARGILYICLSLKGTEHSFLSLVEYLKESFTYFRNLEVLNPFPLQNCLSHRDRQELA